MEYKNIERGEWGAFLTSFARQHQNWLVTVVTIAGDRASLLAGGEHRPLRELRLEHNQGVERVMVGLGGDRHAELVVAEPKRITLEEEDEDGAHRALAIEGATGGLRLQFRVSVPSEQVDGMF